MVLAEKPPTWLQVMYVRLKHLIISSEKFKEIKKAVYNTHAETGQINKGRGIGKHSKGVRFSRVGGKGNRWLKKEMDRERETLWDNTTTVIMTGEEKRKETMGKATNLR